jgi:hypothetical protein
LIIDNPTMSDDDPVLYQKKLQTIVAVMGLGPAAASLRMTVEALSEILVKKHDECPDERESDSESDSDSIPDNTKYVCVCV